MLLNSQEGDTETVIKLLIEDEKQVFVKTLDKPLPVHFYCLKTREGAISRPIAVDGLKDDKELIFHIGRIAKAHKYDEVMVVVPFNDSIGFTRFNFVNKSFSAVMYIHTHDKEDGHMFTEPMPSGHEVYGDVKVFTEEILRGFVDTSNQDYEETSEHRCKDCGGIRINPNALKVDLPGVDEFGDRIKEYFNPATELFDTNALIEDFSKVYIKGTLEAGKLVSSFYLAKSDRGITMPTFMPGPKEGLPIEALAAAAGLTASNASADEIVLFIESVGVKIGEGETVVHKLGPNQFAKERQHQSLIEIRYNLINKTYKARGHFFKVDGEKFELIESTDYKGPAATIVVDGIEMGKEKYKHILSKVMDKLGMGESEPFAPDPDDHLRDINPEDFVP